MALPPAQLAQINLQNIDVAQQRQQMDQRIQLIQAQPAIRLRTIQDVEAAVDTILDKTFATQPLVLAALKLAYKNNEIFVEKANVVMKFDAFSVGASKAINGLTQFVIRSFLPANEYTTYKTAQSLARYNKGLQTSVPVANGVIYPGFGAVRQSKNGFYFYTLQKADGSRYLILVGKKKLQQYVDSNEIPEGSNAFTQLSKMVISNRDKLSEKRNKQSDLSKMKRRVKKQSKRMIAPRAEQIKFIRKDNITFPQPMQTTKANLIAAKEAIAANLSLGATKDAAVAAQRVSKNKAKAIKFAKYIAENEVVADNNDIQPQVVDINIGNLNNIV